MLKYAIIVQPMLNMNNRELFKRVKSNLAYILFLT